jgi:hypothetical protein
MWPKKRVIDDIFTKFGGDTGGMEDARLEPLALLWITRYFGTGSGWVKLLLR